VGGWRRSIRSTTRGRCDPRSAFCRWKCGGRPASTRGLETCICKAYTCDIIRNGLSFLLSGGLDETDLVVVPHGCDSLQGLGSVLLDFVKSKQPVLTLYLPRGDESDTEKAIRFFADEFRLVSVSLEAITGRRPSDADLVAAIESEEKAARCAADLLRERRRLPLDDRDFYRLLRSREFLPAETFEAIAMGALARRTQTPRAGTPVVVSGIVPEPVEFLDALNHAGGFVAGDDLVCTGRRHVVSLPPKPVPEDERTRKAD